MKKLFILFLSVISIFALCSCTKINQKLTYVVNGKVYESIDSNVAVIKTYRNNTGCYFFGWYSDPECTTIYTDFNKELESDLTLYGVSLSYFDILKNHTLLQEKNEVKLVDGDYLITMGLLNEEEIYLTYSYQDDNYERKINYYPERNTLIQEYTSLVGVEKVLTTASYLVTESYEKNNFRYSLTNIGYTYNVDSLTTFNQRHLQENCNEAAYNIINTIFYECNKIIKVAIMDHGNTIPIAIPSFKQINTLYQLSVLEKEQKNMENAKMVVTEVNEFSHYTGEGFVKGIKGIYQKEEGIYDKYLLVLEFDNAENAQICSIKSDEYYTELLKEATYSTDLLISQDDKYVYIYTSNAEYLKR